jgi:hypothetical protein
MKCRRRPIPARLGAIEETASGIAKPPPPEKDLIREK